MARFSIDLPDNINAWLQQQADENSRTKNGQLVYLLEQIQHVQARRVIFICGYNLPCTFLRHYWCNDVPMENEGCNCGKVRW